MNRLGLHAGTPVYYDINNVYDVFSQAEDYPKKIESFLLPYIKNKEIIDFGCGTGKYTNIFAPYVKHIHAIDASANQIESTKQHTKDHNNISYYIIEDGKVPTTQATYLIACRVFGTIQDKLRRSIVFQNVIKSLPKGCTIFLIENDAYGGFENIRGKTNIIPSPTIVYNTWLEEQGCVPIKKIDTYFQFPTIEIAINTFTSIRGEEVGKNITSSRIEHKVLIYKYVVN